MIAFAFPRALMETHLLPRSRPRGCGAKSCGITKWASRRFAAGGPSQFPSGASSGRSTGASGDTLNVDRGQPPELKRDNVRRS